MRVVRHRRDSDSDSEPPRRSWKAQARYAALVMYQAVRKSQRPAPGWLASAMRRLPDGSQAAAATELREWAMRWFGKDGKDLSDNLLGVKMVRTIDPVLRPLVTNGRSVRAGVPEAVAAVRQRVSMGIGTSVAAREVADLMIDQWGEFNSDAQLARTLRTYRAPKLARSLYDAYLRDVKSSGE